jgi:hypothetical protein
MGLREPEERNSEVPTSGCGDNCLFAEARKAPGDIGSKSRRIRASHVRDDGWRGSRSMGSPMNDARSAKRLSLWEDTRGTVMLEYSILMGTVAIGSAIAFISLGVAFVNNFDLVRGLLLAIIP